MSNSLLSFSSIISAFLGLIGVHLLFYYSLFPNADNISGRSYALIMFYNISIDVFLSHTLLITLSLSTFLYPYFCPSLMVTTIGLWSDMNGFHSNCSTSMFSSRNPLVAIISIFVSFYFIPAPFLVQLSVSSIFHPSLVAFLFHYLYFGCFTSVFMSMYITYGYSYCCFNSLISLFIFCHLYFPLPFSACIPAMIHFVVSLFVIILATCLASLNIFLAGL